MLWDVASGRELRTLVGHERQVLCAAFSPDGRTIASGSQDYTAKLWDVATGREVRTFYAGSDFVWSVAFTPDGSQLTTASGTTILDLGCCNRQGA